VQWVRRCHRPRGEGRPGWRIAADLAASLSIDLPGWTSTGDVLKSMADSVEPFGEMTEERLGLLGFVAKPHAAASA
jgi:predicted molibdopterin-dependent oxidoreductase YjgC